MHVVREQVSINQTARSLNLINIEQSTRECQVLSKIINDHSENERSKILNAPYNVLGAFSIFLVISLTHSHFDTHTRNAYIPRIYQPPCSLMIVVPDERNTYSFIRE